MMVLSFNLMLGRLFKFSMGECRLWRVKAKNGSSLNL